jgi:hypothetical protein
VIDRWGRYLIVPQGGSAPVAHTRATTLAATLDDRYALERWSRRMLAQGLVKRPDLLAAVAACDVTERDELDRFCDQALEAGGSSTSATLGSALHKFCERVDRGELDLADVPDPWRADVTAYRCSLEQAGFEVEFIERTCVVPELTVAGTLDRTLVDDCDRRYIADIKTGQSLDRSWPSIAVQLAVYSRATTFFDPDTGHTPMPEVSRTVGIVVHVPAGRGTCELVGIDVAAGWEGALLAHRVRQYRRIGFRSGLASHDTTARRRACLAIRVRRLVDQYPVAAQALANGWPVGTPTFRQDGHTPVQLDEIAELLQEVEVAHHVPSEDLEPLPAHRRRKRKEPK